MSRSHLVVGTFALCACLATEILPGKASPVGKAQGKGPYDFVPDTDRWVAIAWGNAMSIGKLDSNGTFLPEKAWVNLNRSDETAGAPAYTIINAPGRKNVYEYRFGRLIPGDIDKEGNFVPHLDDRVIDFKDYRYRPDGPQIYNLPGRFVRRSADKAKR